MEENTEIIYVCNSINNKNVRANELKLLEKHPEELYFIFGESNENAKKRYYNNLDTLNKDFEALLKIKKDLEKKTKKQNKKTTLDFEQEDKDFEEGNDGFFKKEM